MIKLRLKSCVFQLLILFLVTLFCAKVYSGDLTQTIVFNSPLSQGSLVTGWVTPGVKLEIDTQPIVVRENGQFVYGLNRDHPATLTISVIEPGEKKKMLTYSVIQREYETQSINGVASKYVAPPKELSKRIAAEAKLVREARATNRKAQDYLAKPIMPAQGPITGVYGSQRIFNNVPKRPHFGLDIAGPIGTAVIAPLSGVVSLAHPDMFYSGGTLIIDHGDGVSSTFIHLHKIDVSKGDSIVQGQKIAEIGATGRVTGPHLDWRINWFAVRLDPALLFDAPPSRE